MKLWAVKYRRKGNMRVDCALVRAPSRSQAVEMIEQHLEVVYNGHSITHIIISTHKVEESPMIVLVNGYDYDPKR
jgi:hypothetical protein